MVHLQEYGCKYSYGLVRFKCIGISSVVGRRVRSICNRLPEDEPSASKRVEDIKKVQIKALI
jgi:hypothetical protein